MFTKFAEVVTVLGFLIAVVGVYFAYRTRPRLSFDVIASNNDSIDVTLRKSGARSARNVEVTASKRRDDGTAGGGGDILTLPVMDLPVALHFFHPTQVFHSGNPHPHPTKLGSGMGLDLLVTWQSPILPWKSKSMMARWSPEARSSGAPPLVLHGRRALREFELGSRFHPSLS